MTEVIDRPTGHGDEFDADDVPSSPETGKHFSQVLEARLSRRNVLQGGMVAAAGFLTTRLVTDTPSAYAAPGGVPGKPAAPAASGPLLGFRPVPLSTADEVVVPRGYRSSPFIPWGTALHPNGPTFVPGSPDAIGTGNTAAEQEQQIGMHHDGMHFFPIGKAKQASRHGLLVVNHEYTDEGLLHTATPVRPARETYTPDMVRKSQAAHGVSVVEVREDRRGSWKVMPSKLNRRVTAYTPMTFSGPAAGSRLLRTDRPADGRTPVGTINNCSHGYTPWNTYLACEENFNGYFAVTPGAYSPEDAALQQRYGVGGDGYQWSTHDKRFEVTPARAHEPNRFGWVVEIDPFSPGSTPVKRTALGRMKHEGAAVHVADSGHLVVYMGDDQVNEYAYKFVSARPWRDMAARGTSPLDEGTLYVARYDDDGSGTWLPLVHGQGPLTAANGFADQGDVLVKTRAAADALGATRMDRPEWTTVDPTTGMVYLTLTNNTSGSKVANAANPRKPNRWGHIVRWEEAGNDHTATTFAWDLFLIAGQGRETGDGSTIDADDAFGSPDGIWADPDGRVWIQTDGTQPAGANDQMLAADPTTVDAEGRPEIRRFFTGVVDCEVTGVITTPDQRTMFVNLQHPGDGGTSSWPRLDGITVPRSATVVVVKDDGGIIGT
jgi:secreted PhoX family phosphatase